MQRNKATYPLAPAQAGEMKQRMLNWANQFGILLFLDNNSYPSPYAGYECLLGAGVWDSTIVDIGDGLKGIQNLHDERRDWLFGHIAYDYKNNLEAKLSSNHEASIGFPRLHFFQPRVVCYIDRAQTSITIEAIDDAEAIYQQILAADDRIGAAGIPKLQFTGRVGREQYIDTINKLRTHIGNGDCYEINYCTEGYCEGAAIVPLQVFHALNKLSPAPFAAYYRMNELHMMCASPERYLHKQGPTVLSQPIKGTARRDKDEQTDNSIKEALRNDIKERAENVMIVDLVRNDLARCCKVGSVQVDELFGVYSFPQVHQLISTVSGTLQQGRALTDAIRYSFPMGSMTGAPKHKVMQLIEQYEHSRRELFSGTVGYITPGGDFDFNVIIRSLFYNEYTQYLAYQTGGAITWDSIPEKEWDEMRLKAWALERIFQ